jgi:hypothetical protein
LTSKKEKPKKKKTDEEKITTDETPTAQKPPEQTPIVVEPQPPLESLTYPFKVLVSPLKAFKKISLHPDMKGLAVVIGLLMLASAAVQLSVGSKILLNGTSLVATSFFQNLLVSGVFETVFIFLLSWLFFAGPLLLISTIMGAKGEGGWRPFFVIVGYALTVFILRTVVSAVLISTLPQINFNLSAWPPATEAEVTEVNNQISTIWGPILTFQVGGYVNLAFDAWLVFLAAIAVHAYRVIPWSRAATISATAYLIYFTLRLFVGF